MTIVIRTASGTSVSDSGFGSASASTRRLPACHPFAASTGFVAPAVNFALQFQGREESAMEDHEHAENDPTEGGAAVTAEDGSNVVSVDFSRKK